MQAQGSKANFMKILSSTIAAVDYFVTKLIQTSGIEMNAVPHQNTKYDWKKLADGKWRKWYQGKEFKCSLRSFRIQIYQAAARMGCEASTRCRSGETFIAFCICNNVDTKKK